MENEQFVPRSRLTFFVFRLSNGKELKNLVSTQAANEATNT